MRRIFEVEYAIAAVVFSRLLSVFGPIVVRALVVVLVAVSVTMVVVSVLDSLDFEDEEEDEDDHETLCVRL